MEKYALKERLGEGSYGIVWKAQRGNNFMAVKVIEGVNFFRKDDVESQIAIMAKLSHPNLVKIHEHHYDEGCETMYIVMDYCELGDLLHYINLKNKELSNRQILGIFKQLVNAFLFMNSKGVIHRDLKPENILVTSAESIKIADFGCARNMKKDEISKLVTMSLDKGTPCFAAPELLQSQPYSFKCDVWSAGCIIYFLAVRKLPFFAKKVTQIITIIKEKTQGKDIEIPIGMGVPVVAEEIKYVIRRCLRYKEVERASWRQFPLARIFNQKITSIRQFCEYAKNLSNIANWISKYFWKERKTLKTKEANGNDEIFVYFIIKFQLSALQLGLKTMERDPEYRYLFEDAAWLHIDVDDAYYKEFRDIHLKETTQYFTMLKDCPKSDAANKAIKQKEHGMLLPFADLQNSMRAAYRFLTDSINLLDGNSHKVFLIMSRWVNFQKHFEYERKPNLQKIIAEKNGSVSEEVKLELTKSTYNYV